TATQSASVTYTLPPADGNNNYVLTTNGSGLLSWQSSSGIGAGTITAVGNITSGNAFTGADLGNNLTFQGSTSTVDANNITLTAVNPAASVTYTLPDIGTNSDIALLAGTQTFTGSKTFNSDVTIGNNANLSLSSGTGVFSQTYSSGSNNTSAQVLGITNNNTGATSTAVNGINLSLTNVTNA